MLPGQRVVTPSGDATGVADLASIQAACTAVGNAGGGTVFFAPGDYTVGGTITIPLGVGLEGVGCNGIYAPTGAPVIITHLPAAAPAAATPLFVNYTQDSGYAYLGPLVGLHLKAGTNSSNACYFTGVAEIMIQRCAFLNFPVGLRCSYTLCCLLEQTYIEGNKVGGNFAVEILAGVGQSTTFAARDCRWRQQEYCLMVNDNACHSTWLEDCIFESCLKGIARLQDGHTVIRNAYVEAMNDDAGSTALVVASDGAEYELTLINSSNTFEQSAPVAIADGNTAITIAELKTRLLTMHPSTARAPTVPAGTAVYGTEANPGIAVGQAIDWSLINIADDASTITVTAAEGHTLVGKMTVAQNEQGMFRTRCTAANTAITYRLA